jgi:formate dehydrogenase subunit gamma
MMTQSSDATGAAPTTLRRFSRAERWTHRTLGILTGLLLITAALLYIPDLSAIAGNRTLLRNIHVYSGFALPIPIIVACFFVAFRLDAGRLNRFTRDDWTWLRSRDRRSGRIPVGKFNAGQKLNASFTLGTVIVMFLTGVIMYGWLGDTWRTGATFVHDWLALIIAVMVGGHMWMAYSDPVARLGMRTGSVPASWARREHGQWADEETSSAISEK